MPTQWNSAAAAITTSASRSVIRWSETIAGTIPRRNSSRARRSAMFVTIWMWTHEWSVSSRRAALTPAMCHHALTCGSALTASKSWSRRRLPRVGARIRIAAIASVGVGGGACADGGGGTAGGVRAGAAAGVGGFGLLHRGQGTRGPARGYFSVRRAAVVLDRDGARAAAGGERGAHRRGRAGLQHDHAADLRRSPPPYISLEKPLSITSGTKPSANAARVGRRWPSLSTTWTSDALRRIGVLGVVDHAAEQQVVARRAGDRRGARRRLPAQRPVRLGGRARRTGRAPLPPGWP